MTPHSYGLCPHQTIIGLNCCVRLFLLQYICIHVNNIFMLIYMSSTCYWICIITYTLTHFEYDINHQCCSRVANASTWLSKMVWHNPLLACLLGGWAQHGMCNLQYACIMRLVLKSSHYKISSCLGIGGTGSTLFEYTWLWKTNYWRFKYSNVRERCGPWYKYSYFF